jgi:hypothetical protein
VARDLKQNQDEGALLDIPNVQQPVGGLPADSKPIVL